LILTSSELISNQLSILINYLSKLFSGQSKISNWVRNMRMTFMIIMRTISKEWAEDKSLIRWENKGIKPKFLKKKRKRGFFSFAFLSSGWKQSHLRKSANSRWNLPFPTFPFLPLPLPLPLSLLLLLLQTI